MDCNTARLYLQFVRAGEAAELDEHLAHCNECNALVLANDRLDQHLGRAMLAVEVPRGLKGQILQRLASERPGWYRRFRGPGGILAAAAVLLAMVGAAVLFYKPARTPIELEQVLYSFNLSRPAEDVSNYQLQKLAAGQKVPRNCAPDFVKYQYLVGMPSLAILPGTDDKVIAPQFVFTHPKGHRAVVYVLPRKTYEVEPLASSDHGYPFGLDADAQPEAAFVYLVFHTGKSWRWLEEPKTD